MNNKEIKKALDSFVYDSKYPLYNFTLARAYENGGHNASAFPFYLRAAELSKDTLISYESILRMALCIERQGNRAYSLKGVLLRAISLMPERPEAYFLMARACERNKDWHEAYTFSVIGEQLIKEGNKPLMTNVEYPGHYGFIFERAVSAWWIGLYDESIHLFRKLSKMTNIEIQHQVAVQNNLNSLAYIWKRSFMYDENMYHDLRFKFKGAKAIIENHSQAMQDMFVLMMHDGKRNGSYVEIGCGDPFLNNNTALLETVFEWGGISIDTDENMIKQFKEARKGSTAICADARAIDYSKLLTQDKYDYLQIDCDPSDVSFQVLQRIPFESIKFAVITFEHDNFNEPEKQVKQKSRKYLESFGYQMVVNNISQDRFSDYEDWWIHPDLINPIIVKCMTLINDNIKKADDYILSRI